MIKERLRQIETFEEGFVRFVTEIFKSARTVVQEPIDTPRIHVEYETVHSVFETRNASRNTFARPRLIGSDYIVFFTLFFLSFFLDLSNRILGLDLFQFYFPWNNSWIVVNSVVSEISQVTSRKRLQHNLFSRTLLEDQLFITFQKNPND